MKSRDKLDKLKLHLQKKHGLQTREVADLRWAATTLKAKLPFDHVTNVRSRDNMKKLYLHFHETYGR